MRVLCLFLMFISLAAFAEERQVINVGLSTDDSWRLSTQLVNATEYRLKAKLSDFRIQFLRMPPDMLRKAIETQKVDIFIASSGFFRQMIYRGARDLATAVSVKAPNPNYGDASVILVPFDKKEVTSLAHLRDKSILVNPDFGLAGYEYVLGDVRKNSDSPRTFFPKKIRASSSTEELLVALKTGIADALILPACQLEEYSRTSAADTSWLRVVNGRQHSLLRCLHSTDLYPNLTIATLPTTPPEISQAVTQVLMAMSPIAGWQWGVATDYSRIDRLLHDLELDEFASYRKNWLTEIWEKWQLYIYALVIFVFLLLGHSALVSRQVRLRTAELRKALDEQQYLHEQAKEAATRIEKLQKLGTIGQMSSLFAHELRQPISSIICYAFSLTRRNSLLYEDETISDGLEEIRLQAERADGIIRRVRSYVKARSHTMNNIAWRSTIEKAIREFKNTTTATGTDVRFVSESDVIIRADPLEMELVVINLLRNASEAQAGMKAPRIDVELTQQETSARLSIRDYGPTLAVEDFMRIRNGWESSKPEGLGLGLSIVRSLVETHNGTIEFHAAEKGGLIVTITLPTVAEPLDNV